MTTLAVAGQHADILASLRRLEGRATVGDVVADSGLPADDVRSGLRALLESHRGHLAVTDSGEMVFEFDPRLIRRGREPLLARIWRSTRRTLQAAFKAWIVVMLVVYFVVFVVLVIAAIFASQKGDSRGGGWKGGRGRGSLGFDPVFWYWIWGPRWRIGRPYYGHRWERTLGKDDRVPFYKKVFAFVFGPDQPKPGTRQIDRSRLRLIRARSGVLSTAELVEHTGSTVDEAEEEMGRLLGTYDGEAAVSPRGTLVYAFPGLMASVDDARTRLPLPAWKRLEPKLELTGNTTGANAAVIGMNAFTLVAAATAPSFIFPRLGIGGPAAFWGLVIVPVVFSVLFFAGPLLRMAGVAIENRRRGVRNLRRVLTGYVWDRALRGEAVDAKGAAEFVRGRMPERATRIDQDVPAILQEMAAALDAHVEVGDDGAMRWRFDRIRSDYAESDSVRKRLELDRRPLGDVVFSTSDTAAEADARDQALFDRELDPSAVDLRGYLPAVDGVDIEEPFELVAFDEELRGHRG